MSQGQFKVNGEGGEHGPKDELDLYDAATEPQVEDPFLSETNLGLGNYGEQELWQQVESFKQGMYAQAGFGKLVLRRAVKETIHGLGAEAWSRLEEEQKAEHDRRRWILNKGRERWNEAASIDDEQEKQEKMKDLLRQHAGVDEEFTAPHMRMLMVRHEVSRSRGARLMDNLFKRVDVTEIKGSDPAKKSLIGGN